MRKSMNGMEERPTIVSEELRWTAEGGQHLVGVEFLELFFGQLKKRSPAELGRFCLSIIY